MCAEDRYLECLRCRWAFSIETTEENERCTECDGPLMIRTEGYEPSCPRCGQTGSNDVCTACVAREHEPQGDVVRLFEPAPAVMPGQLAL